MEKARQGVGMRCRVNTGVTVKATESDRHCWRISRRHDHAPLCARGRLQSNGGGTSTRISSRYPPGFQGRGPQRGFGGAPFQATAAPSFEEAGGDVHTGCARAAHAPTRTNNPSELTVRIFIRQTQCPSPHPSRATRASPPPDGGFQMQIFAARARSESARSRSWRGSRRRSRSRRLHPHHRRLSACRWRGSWSPSGRR